MPHMPSLLHRIARHVLPASLACALLGACAGKPQNTEPVSIKLGESFESFQERYSNRVEAYQPMGANFAKIHWPAKAMGVVRFEHGGHSFEIPHVQYVGGREESAAFKSDGLSRFTVSAAASAKGRVSPSEAQQAFYALLRGLQEAGWQRVNGFSVPRLKGKDSYDYMRQTLEGSLDADYMPPVDEWLKFTEAPYGFYADGVFLEVRFDFLDFETKSDAFRAYVFIFNFEGSHTHFRSHLEDKDRPEWRSKIREAIAGSLADRQVEEAKLRARGIAIDESCQDPPFPEGI